MKKFLFISIVCIIALVGCSNEEKADTTEPIKIKTEDKVEKETKTSTEPEEENEIKEEEKETTISTQPEEKEETEVKEEVKTTVTLEDFNKLFKQDESETQYPNGKFELQDGSIVNADFFSYIGNDVSDYTTAIFSEGELAAVQFETSKSIDEIEKALGIAFEDSQVEKNRIGYEVTLNETFKESNISVYPFEW